MFVDIKFAHNIYVDKLLILKWQIKIRTNCMSADTPLNCFENAKAAVMQRQMSTEVFTIK